jgi:hypothetical protein
LGLIDVIQKVELFVSIEQTQEKAQYRFHTARAKPGKPRPEQQFHDMRERTRFGWSKRESWIAFCPEFHFFSHADHAFDDRREPLDLLGLREQDEKAIHSLTPMMLDDGHL